MTFYAFGLNHRQAPVQLRERFALDVDATRALLREIRLSDDGELILLSTCNRTEAYVYGTDADVVEVRRLVCHHAGLAWPAEHSFELRDEEAVRHVLQVACGLQSLVLGDAQIFAQMKDAYRLAVEEDRVGTAMHRLMHTAFRTAKQVINETGLNTGAASVPRVAVQVARTRLAEGLADRRILVVGAGEMARQALEALQTDEPAHIAIVNRSADRARELAEASNAAVVAWEERHRAVAGSDVVIVATSADEPVVCAAELPSAPQGRSILLVDVSVPRNVDRAVDAMPGYEVFDLDDLNAWLVQTEGARRASVPAAESICEQMLSEFVSWVFHQQALQPAIQAIRDTFENIRRQEVERHHHRLSDIDRKELDRLTESIMQKLLAVPVVRLKSVDPDSVDFVHGIKLLYALFSRPDCEDESAHGDDVVVNQTRLRSAPEEEARCAAPLDAAHQCPFFAQGEGAEEEGAQGDGAQSGELGDPVLPLHQAVREAIQREAARGPSA